MSLTWSVCGYLHEISPLDFVFQAFHFPTEIGSQNLEYPSVRVLVGQRPEGFVNEMVCGECMVRTSQSRR